MIVIESAQDPIYQCLNSSLWLLVPVLHIACSCHRYILECCSECHISSFDVSRKQWFNPDKWEISPLHMPEVRHLNSHYHLPKRSSSGAALPTPVLWHRQHASLVSFGDGNAEVTRLIKRNEIANQLKKVDLFDWEPLWSLGISKWESIVVPDEEGLGKVLGEASWAAKTEGLGSQEQDPSGKKALIRIWWGMCCDVMPRA